MTKQVHIHIHRTKARDAGEGEGKWITLSPSGTHVKLDGKGEITAGPKGMSGKKPSELSSKKSAAPKPIKHATGQGQSFLPSQPKMAGGSVVKTGSGFTAKNHQGFKEYFKPDEEEKAKAFAASGAEAPSKGKPEGGAHEEDRQYYLNVVRDPKNANTAALREAIDYWHEVGTKAGHGGQEHAASQQRMRMAVNELHARGEKVPGFEKPKVTPISQNQKIAAEMKKASAPDLTKHSQYTKADYDYFKAKGWTDPEIKQRWDEEAAKGQAPNRVNKFDPPSVFGPATGEGPRGASRGRT